MIETAFYNGEDISSHNPAEILIEKGMSEDRIDLIQTRAYQMICCQDMEDCNAHPVIDYGIPKVLYYEAIMPALNEYNKRFPKRIVWRYCPFCGKPTEKVIHPDRQTSIDGTF